MWGPFFVLGAFWWVVPLICFLVCLAFMFMAFRSGRHGCGGMCMGGGDGAREKTPSNAGQRGAGPGEF